MFILQVIIITAFFITCGVLIFLVMIQSGKGGGLNVFGGGGSNTTFGTSTMDVVTKATWYAGAAFFGLSILAAVAFADKRTLPGKEPGKDGKPPAGAESSTVPGEKKANDSTDTAKQDGEKTAPEGNTEKKTDSESENK